MNMLNKSIPGVIEVLILKNAKVITQERIIENGGIIIQEDKITGVFKNDEFTSQENTKVIDVNGYYISAGFIDIHTHGGGGYDFMDGSLEAFIEGVRAHLPYGTTSIVPTTLTSTKESLFKTFDIMKEVKNYAHAGPNILGIHLEGPYIAHEQKGAQDPKYIKDPDQDEYMEILNYSDDIVRWTIAPERPGALQLGKILTERGIVCSIGHSNAVYEQVLEAYEHGFNLITHFYSGMSMVRRINAFRYAGVVESGYLIDDMFVEVIADGMHLPSSLLKLIYKIKGPDRICLVTDSMRAAGMPEGEYILGSLEHGQKVIVEDGVAKLMNRKSFAGSVATADRLVRNMIKLADVPLQQAVKMMTYNPAKIMGVEKSKGSIAVGKDADIIVFDQEINIKMVMVGGKIHIDKLDGNLN